MPKRLPCFEQPASKELVKELTAKYDLDLELIQDLAELIQQHSGSGRRHNIVPDIADAIDRFVKRQSQDH